MLAEYNLPLPNSTSSWGDEPLFLGNDDDLFQLDINLVHLNSDDTTLNGAMTFDLFEEDIDNCISVHEGRYIQQETNKNCMEGMFGSPGSDYLNGAFLNALQEPDTTESEAQLAVELLQSGLDAVYRIEISDSDESIACSSQSTVNSCPSSPMAKRTKLNNLQWSEMDMDEQQRAVDEVTRAITDQASIREQLELLRIIGQDMTVLPSDNRFTINAANIDDSKLHAIHDYLAQMALHTTAVEEQPSCQEQHSTASNETRNKKSLERRSRHKAHRRRRNKEKKQAQKEQQSRLFAHEEVLSLQLQDDDDDEEINILD